MGVALDLAERERETFNSRTARLRDRIEAALLDQMPDAKLNGHREHRLSNILNLSFPGVEGEPILLGLDFAAICASSGSACSSASVEPSHVLIAMGLDADLAVGSIRLSLGKDNTDADAEAVIEELPRILGRLRGMPHLASGVSGD